MLKLIHFNLFIVGTLLLHSACSAIPGVLRHDVDGVLELSKAAAQRTLGHESVVFIETTGEEAATGFLVDPWTVVTIGHTPMGRETKVVLGSINISDVRIKENEGKAALCLKTIVSRYAETKPTASLFETLRESGAEDPSGISVSLFNSTEDWRGKIEDISSGKCHRWEPFVKGRRHEDFKIIKLDRPLSSVSTFLKYTRRLPLGFQEWDTTIVGYPGSIAIGDAKTVFDDGLTQLAMKNRFFYSHKADVFFTPFSGYDQMNPRRFNVCPSYMDPLAGVTGSGMSGSPVIDNITNRVIGVISGRMRQEQGEAEGISLNIAQPLAPHYDLIKASLGIPY